MSYDKEKFILAEYNTLRGEIEAKISEVNAIIRWGLIGIAAIWTWLATTPSSGSVFAHIEFLPLALSVFLYLRILATRSEIFRIAKYIVRIETAFELPAGLGWETQLNIGREFHRGSFSDLRDRWEDIFWIALSLGNFLIAASIEFTSFSGSTTVP